MTGARLVSAVLLLVALPWGLPALQQQPDPVRLTMEEALQRAERNNPRFRQATAELELNTLDNRDQWLAILPQPRIRLLNTSMNWRRTTVAEDFFGNPLENPEEQSIRTSSSSQSVGLGLTVDLANFLEFRRRNEEAEVREMNVEVGFHELRADVTSAFLDLQEQEGALELERELLEVARVNRDLAERLYVLARRDRIDLVSLELDVAEQEHELDQVRAQVEEARLALRNLIGDPELGEFDIVPVELPPFDPGDLDVDALVRAARDRSPDVRQAEAGLRQEEQAVGLVRAQWLPTVGFNWGRTRQGFVRGSDAFMDFDPAAEWDRSISLSVSFPDLGQYFQRRNERRRTEVGVRTQRENLRAVRNDVEREVRSLVNDLRASARSLELQERRAELAAERMELAREAYRLGQQSYLELQSAQQQAAEARRQALAAGYAFHRARVALERAAAMSVSQMLELGGEG